MTIFESEVVINNTVENVYSFLTDMNNHRKLMPDNVVNWQSDADVASFEIQNITKLSLKIEERIQNALIRIVPNEKAPFEMELKWEISSTENSTAAAFIISADLNMLMKMVASSPLKKLTEEETLRLKQLLDTF